MYEARKAAYELELKEKLKRSAAKKEKEEQKDPSDSS